MNSYHSCPAELLSTSVSYDSSSVSSSASPTTKASLSMSFATTIAPNRSMSNLSPFQNAHHPAPPHYAKYDSVSISPNEQATANFDSFASDSPTLHGSAPNHISPTSPHNAKRAYRQRRKDPSCDACRERKVKCDATGASSCSECLSRNVRCQFTKDTNKRMSSIKQVQDLERQLFQAKQQVDYWKAMVSKENLSIGLTISNPPHYTLDLPPFGSPLRRGPKLPIVQNFSHVRLNLRRYSGSLLKSPAPYRRIGSQQELPLELPKLPPKQTADRLLGQYFSHVHLQFPILHKPTFYAEYQAVYREGSINGMRRGWGAVLFCVLACGTVHTLGPNRLQEGKEYLSKATTLIDLWQDDLSVDEAKMAFLASIFLTEANLRSAAWVWLGVSARTAQDAGLHVETVPLPMVEKETRRRLWYSIYAFDRLLALEFGKPLMIDDNACDVEYPEPEDDQYVTNDEPLQNRQSTSLLATIHVVRSVQPLVRLFKSEYLSPETMQTFDRHFDVCHDSLPRPLSLSSKEPLNLRSIAPVIYLQNTRMMLHRHNLSPRCPSEARYRAVKACIKIASNTSQLVSRCMGQASATRYDFAVSATTLLCTHLWRCSLFLVFGGEYEAALTLVQAFSAISSARTVTVECGRYIAFFIRCITDYLESGAIGDFEQNEQLMAYVSADMQSSAENGWVWEGSGIGTDLGANSTSDHDRADSLQGVGNSDRLPFARGNLSGTMYDHVSAEEALQEWDDWEQVDRSLRHLSEKQRLQRQRVQSRDSHFPSITIPALQLQPARQQQQEVNLGNSRMIIANII